MSYSRWSNSSWYTFWTSNGSTPTEYKFPNKKLKYEQCFEVCDFPSYVISYKDIVDKGPQYWAEQIADFYRAPRDGKIFAGRNDSGEFIYEPTIYPGREISKEEVDELTEYIKEFVVDIDNDFTVKEFILYNWYYPIRNSIINSIRKLFQ